jgi:light-regulated signal transduction histidine kinase (bacteriophytochrome)
MWFRPEVVRTIEWAGDPTKPTGDGSGRLNPRKSFATWRDQVRARSEPWSESEIEAARDFRTAVIDVVLRRAEERAELTEELQRANKELEAFSYSVSHDLRAPFRHIVGYAELLQDRSDNLDETSRHYLVSIIDAALSAGRLVDDLLHFSQLGRTRLATGRADMNKLVAEVRRTMAPDLKGRAIEWRVDPLPEAWGDPSMLRQVWANLIGNAVKYSRDRDPAIIAITAEETPSETVYTVADNGAGFDMTYAGKLFGVFQRLHRVDEFEGSGIGLALVQRIVHRHGGRVWADGAVGKGARFSFALPRQLGSK